MKLRKLLIWTLPPVVVLALVLTLLTTTETGLRVILASVNAFTKPALDLGSATGTLMGPFQLHKVRYANATTSVDIDSITVHWLPRLLLDGQVHVQNAEASKVRVISKDSTEPTIPSAFSLPFHLVVDSAQVRDINIASPDEEYLHLDTTSVHNIHFQGDTLTFADGALTAGAQTLQIQGGLQTTVKYPVNATVKAQFNFEGYQPITATGTLTGPFNEMGVNVDTQTPAVVHLQGQLKGLLDPITTWSATATSANLALTDINRQWAEQRFRNVMVHGQGDLAKYNLTVQTDTGLPSLLKPVAVTASLAIDMHGLTCSRLIMTQDKASLTAQGQLLWSPSLSWQADIQGTQLNPGVFSPQWPGNFSGHLVSQGHTQPRLQASFKLSDLKGTLRQYPLSGGGQMELVGDQLQNTEIRLASGASTVEIKGATAPNFDVAALLRSPRLTELWPTAAGSLDARLHLDGTMKQPHFTLQLAGEKLALAKKYAIGQLRAQADGIMTGNGALKASVLLKKAKLSETLVDEGNLRLQGSLFKPEMHIDVRDKLGTAKSTLSSSFTPKQGQAQPTPENAFGSYLRVLSTLLSGQWKTTLRDTTLASKAYGIWHQRATSTLDLAPDQAKLSPLCLETTSSSRICAEGDWNGPSRKWQMRSQLSNMPLAFLAELSGLSWPIQGTLNGSLDAQGKQQALEKMVASFSTRAMQLTAPLGDGQQQKLHWQQNDVRAEYQENQLHLVVNSLMDAHNYLHADIRQPSRELFSDLRSKPIRGTVELNLNNLALIGILSKQYVLPTGTLQGRWDLTGSPLAPHITGHMELLHGKAEIPPLGITLSPLTLSMQGNASKIDLQATAQSGTGTLHITSSLDIMALDRKEIAIHLVGQDFRAADLPDVKLALTPNVNVLLKNDTLTVQGKVTIPHAKITSINFDQVTKGSGDVVIVDSDTQAATTAQPLYLQLALHAGDDVQIDAYGLRGNIKGELQVNSQPGRPFTANGTLNVEKGSFSMYGKRLKIDLGRLLYAGGPLTNPGIELRSEHKTEKVTARMLVNGFLQHPNISFSSTPAMQQSSIITTLLEDTAIAGENRNDIGTVGTVLNKVGLESWIPFLQRLKRLTMIDEIKIDSSNDQQGNTLVLGSWITPDFYVSYGKDLANDTDTFNTRLNLGKGFSLNTATGSAKSSGDIKYEFER